MADERAPRPGTPTEGADPDVAGSHVDDPVAAEFHRNTGAEPGVSDGSTVDAANPADAETATTEGSTTETPATTGPDTTPTGDYGRTWYGRRRRTPRKPRRKAPWWELPALVLLAIGIAILVKSFVVQPFFIPSDSMEKTLHGCPGCHGDRILVNKPVYDLRDPHPGDIVVFDAPSGWDDEPTSTPPSNPVVRTIRGFGQLVGFVPPDGEVLVKRVIATGGQTVKGDSAGHVMVSTSGPNGSFRTLNEPFVFTDGGGQPAFGPVTVPKGRLWVMGDHRNDSADSRYHCSPDGLQGTGDDLRCDPTRSTVPIGNVVGKAFVIAWPPSRWRTLGTPATFTSAAQAAGPALPGAASLATVVPLFLLRRRRRRR